VNNQISDDRIIVETVYGVEFSRSTGSMNRLPWLYFSNMPTPTHAQDAEGLCGAFVADFLIA